MKIPKTVLSVLIVFVLVGAVYGTRTVRAKTAEETKAAVLIAPRAMGNAAAKVRVLEFIDYQCPSCAKASSFLTELAKRHPQDLYLEVKYFPLRGHSHSILTAKLVECGRIQGKFWETQKAIFDVQPEWRDLADAKPVLMKALETAGVNLVDADRCQADPEVEARVIAERDAARELGLQSTPSFYINGSLIVGYMSMVAELTKHFPDAADIVPPADNAPYPTSSLGSYAFQNQ